MASGCTIRVSLDHYEPDRARGGARRAELGADHRRPASGWRATASTCDVAGRRFSGRDRGRGARRLCRGCSRELGMPIDARDPVRAGAVPGDGRPASTCRRSPRPAGASCGKSPDDVMCASAAMVVKRKGADAPGRRRLHPAALRPAVRARPTRWPKRSARCASTIRIARSSACWAARPAASDDGHRRRHPDPERRPIARADPRLARRRPRLAPGRHGVRRRLARRHTTIARQAAPTSW